MDHGARKLGKHAGCALCVIGVDCGLWGVRFRHGSRGAGPGVRSSGVIRVDCGPWGVRYRRGSRGAEAGKACGLCLVRDRCGLWTVGCPLSPWITGCGAWGALFGRDPRGLWTVGCPLSPWITRWGAGVRSSGRDPRGLWTAGVRFHHGSRCAGAGEGCGLCLVRDPRGLWTVGCPLSPWITGCGGWGALFGRDRCGLWTVGCPLSTWITGAGAGVRSSGVIGVGCGLWGVRYRRGSRCAGGWGGCGLCLVRDRCGLWTVGCPLSPWITRWGAGVRSSGVIRVDCGPWGVRYRRGSRGAGCAPRGRAAGVTGCGGWGLWGRGGGEGGAGGERA